ncbi:MAG: ABC transporter ATP-binding protein [Streptomyces sp.]|nr:ABC transporter ATP-binding protein [Streptomyces sp.]
MRNAVEAVGLGHRYGRKWALQDCSLSLPSERVIGLVGPNGAGKTTLLHLAVGLLQPSVGEVRVLGRDPRDPGTLAHVGFVAQDKPLYGHFTVAETLRMGGWLNPAWDRRLAEKRVARLDVPLTQKVGRLSGGQRSQLALALALGKRPELLLVDEPVSDLDPLARRDFFRVLMEEVAESGMTVVISSHLLADLERTCEHLVLLSRSRVQFAGDTDDLLARHRMLTGPRGGAAAIEGAHTVVQANYTERQASLLIRVNGPVDVTGWQVRNISLEDLLLAYMAAPHLIDDTLATAKKEQVLS